MKKLICAVLAVVCCLGLVACGSGETVPDGYQLVSDDSVTFRFYAPTQWSVNNAGGIYSVYYSSTDRSMVMVSAYRPNEDELELDNFWASVEDDYERQYTNFELLSEEATMLGDRNARAFTFTAGISGGDYKVMQIVTGYGSYYYTMTYMALTENFDAHVEAVRGMASVFEFR